jgi:hypothetical protein
MNSPKSIRCFTRPMVARCRESAGGLVWEVVDCVWEKMRYTRHKAGNKDNYSF